MNSRVLDEAVARRRAHELDPRLIFPWRRPCTVSVLLVTDGGLDFGQGDFGLSTFVASLLNDGRTYVRFEVTTAHLRSGVSNAQVMAGAPGIAASFKGFAFDDPAQFDPDRYDEIWLFGIETYFHTGSYPNRLNDPNRYPAGRLGDAELLALAQHLNRGGGLFATGDHGYLGAGLCGSVDRIRGMRHWGDFTGPTGENEVSMSGARRNDSNMTGHDAGSQFSDQSDDVPQRLDLKLYSTAAGVLRRARYPHPVLCGRTGRITEFPDHPHEGECREPGDLTAACADGTPEYPPDADGNQVVPEVVAWGSVHAGNDARVGGGPTKLPTQAHRFGVVSTYDGHRAGVGRVVCDSTWHHFVNVNLIGILEGGGFDDFGAPGTDPSKHDGFLSSPAGQAVLAGIRNYYVNVGVWIAPAARHTCMRLRSWWEVVWSDRIVEAGLLDPAVPVRKVSLEDLFHIGVHARDVLGRLAGPCQTLEWNLPLLDLVWEELRPWVNPWDPIIEERREPSLPVLDAEPFLAVALGGAVVALRQEFPYAEEQQERERDERAVEVLTKGMAEATERAREEFARDLEQAGRLARR